MWDNLWVPAVKIYRIVSPGNKVHEIPGVNLSMWLTRMFGYKSPVYTAFEFKAKMAKVSEKQEVVDVYSISGR